MFCILNAKSNQLSVIRDCILIVNHRKNRNRILRRLIRFRTVVCASCNCSRGIFFDPVTVWQNLRFNQLRRGKHFRRCNSIFLFCEKSCILPFSTNMGQSTGFCTPLINPQFSAHQQLIRVGDLFGLINQRRLLYTHSFRCERGNGKQQGQTQCQSERDNRTPFLVGGYLGSSFTLHLRYTLSPFSYNILRHCICFVNKNLLFVIIKLFFIFKSTIDPLLVLNLLIEHKKPAPNWMRA